MISYFFLLLSVLSIFKCSYLPFKKNKDFPDNACAYSYKDNLYVKDCESGKYCKDRGDSLQLCESVPNEVVLSSLEGECTSDFECESGLVCTNSKCLFSYDCSTGNTRIRTVNGYVCKDSKTMNVWYTKNFDWIEDSNTYYAPKGGYITGEPTFDYNPEYFKVKGEITEWNTTTETNKGVIYQPKKIVYSTIGSVEDGKFVYDELACQSGFALYFYGNGKLDNPYDGNNYNYMYKRCVTLEDIEIISSNNCKIKYKLDDKSFTYNVNQINGAQTIDESYTINNEYYGAYNPYSYIDYFSYIDNYKKERLCRQDVKIKIDIFKKYVSSLNEEIKKCPKPENLLNLQTCQNNQLRKWSYFYDNIDKYVLYNTDDDKGKTITNYLIQSIFPSYQSSTFLNIKYIFCLLLLFSLF